MGILTTVGSAVEVAEGVERLWGKLNSARGIVMHLNNWTDERLTRSGHHHHHGGWDEPPSAHIPPRSTDIFSSQSKSDSIFTGTEGGVDYTADRVAFRIWFNNPFMGSNSCGIKDWTGDAPEAYRGEHVCGSGNRSKNKYDIYPATERVLSGVLSHAMWCHGHSGQVEHPDRLVRFWRAGMYLRIVPRPGTDNWLHYAVPTTVIVPEMTRLRAFAVLVRYRVAGDASISGVHVYDGENLIARHDDVSLRSGTWELAVFDVPDQPEVRWGIGISLRFQSAGGGPEGVVAVAAAGCDFVEGVVL